MQTAKNHINPVLISEGDHSRNQVTTQIDAAVKRSSPPLVPHLPIVSSRYLSASGQKFWQTGKCNYEL